eukprot:symbB.v1.2.000990.t1/scaffold43.1/size391093/19
MTDHKRAVRYIKRMRMLGLMPYHRLLAKIETDPEAKRPPRQGQMYGKGANAATRSNPGMTTAANNL